MCTRQENLRRHSKRLHNGQGKAILQYILGSSIVTPEETLGPSLKARMHEDRNVFSSYSPNLNQDDTDVYGFKADICQKCFSTRIMPIGTIERRLPKNHKCIPEKRNSIRTLTDYEYEKEYDRLTNLIPDRLFNECKKWAHNTSRRLYLIATKIESLTQDDTQRDMAPIHSNTLPIFSKVIVKSKVLVDDKELREYLKVAKNQTRTIVIDIKNNLRYIVDVSTFRSM